MDTRARGDKKKLRAFRPIAGEAEGTNATELNPALPQPSQTIPAEDSACFLGEGGHGKSCLQQSPTTSVPPRSSTGVVQVQPGGPSWQGTGQECGSARRGAEPGIRGHGQCVWAWRAGREETLWACLRAQVRSCLSKEHKRGVWWGRTGPLSAPEPTSHEGQPLLAVPWGGHEHPAVTSPLLPRAAVGLPSPPTAACFAPRTFPNHPTPSCPTSPTLALPQPPLRPLPKCPGPVLTPPSTPFLLLLLLHPTPKMHPHLSPLAEG